MNFADEAFNFQDILWLRPMLVAYQYFPQLRASQFLSVEKPWNNDTLPYTIAPLCFTVLTILNSGGDLCRTCRVQLHHEVFTTNSGGLQCWSSTRCCEWCQWLRDFFGRRHSWEGKCNDVYGRGSTRWLLEGAPHTLSWDDLRGLSLHMLSFAMRRFLRSNQMCQQV